jgi:hypothetical protein
MPIEQPLHRFLSVLVFTAPDREGLYALWQGADMIYLGCASGTATIKSCLTLHLNGHNPCTENATHFSFEPAAHPAAREAQILAQFQARHGHLPRCNAKAA